MMPTTAFCLIHSFISLSPATHGPPLSRRRRAASFTAAHGLSGSRGGRAQRSDSQRSGGPAHGIEHSSDSTRAQRRRISAREARPRVLRRGGARGLPGASGRRRARTGRGISRRRRARPGRGSSTAAASSARGPTAGAPGGGGA
ncbi:hypothetical protein PVAP13_8NG074800 [Panicum virgatum]|uniref:Uncharacterized protein n=1 Tax=Panicum virgatum TaxID=38727 RepID=A0A8T0P7Z2_PANVG|nr:hypothetical protein PVAP13_8NG074800 [Panicum virgatum]